MNDIPVVIFKKKFVAGFAPEMSPLERAADHISSGLKEVANGIYRDILSNEQQSDNDLFAAAKEYVKLSLATTDEQGKIVYQFASYGLEVKNHYAENASYSHKQKHIQINVELAHSYESMADELAKGLTLFSGIFSGNLFSYTSVEYHQALCIAHLAIASELGGTPSSLRLAHIFQEGKYLLPADIERKNGAARYANLAEAQALLDHDDTTLFLLGQFHQKNGLNKEGFALATRCYEAAAKLGHAAASLTLAKLYYDQGDKVRSAHYSDQVFQRQHLATMLEHGEWCLTRSWVYADQNAIDLATRSLNGITGFKGLKKEDLARYPQMLTLFKTLQELGPCVAAGNNFQLVIHSNAELHLYLTSVNTEKNKHAFMLENNGFFIQLLVAGFSSNDSEIRNKTVQLYHEYMNLKELAPCKKKVTYIGALDETVVGNKEENLEEISKISIEEDSAFVLTHIDDKGNVNVLAVSGQFIASMWDPESDPKWTRGIYSQNHVSQKFEPEQAYTVFPLTREAYRAATRSVFYKIIEVIDFDFKNTSNIGETRACDYRPLFEQAWNSRNLFGSHAHKLTDLGHQLALAEIVNPLLDGADGITDAHHDALCKAFGLDKVNNTDKAIMLFMLAHNFTFLSSEYMFGQSKESPNALRNLAKGYLTKAYALDARVFFTGYIVTTDHFNMWMSHYNGAGLDQCTSSISSEMLVHFRKKGYEKFMKRYIPIPWR